MEQIKEQCPWATWGKPSSRKPNIITSLELDSKDMEQNNLRLQKKYKEISDHEVRYEEFETSDAEYLLIAFGACARICQKAVEEARAQGIRLGLIRPVTLWPFPYKAIAEQANKVKGILSVEMNAGQMVEDVRLAVKGNVPVEFFGRLGGIIPTPDEIVTALKEKIIK